MDKKNKKKVDLILNIILVIAAILCSFVIVFKLSFVKIVVNGSSMNPTIENGSIGYMLKVTQSTKIERFDVVAGAYGDSNHYYIIKRVLGLPGEEIELVDNKLYVNGQETPQDFSFTPSSKNFQTTKWTLQENQYLLVGDNRANTIQPVVEYKDAIIAKNGFAISTYDIASSECNGSQDYSGCPIKNRDWYWFKNGK